jgi:hypothetical protein
MNRRGNKTDYDGEHRFAEHEHDRAEHEPAKNFRGRARARNRNPNRLGGVEVMFNHERVDSARECALIQVPEKSPEYGNSDYEDDHRFAEHEQDKEKGFALIAALLTIWILTALGMLVFTVTTQDVRISSRMVGEKKAFYATEAGVHTLTQGFDPLNLAVAAKSDVQVDSRDPSSRYTIGTPSVPTRGPAAIPIAGYSVGGGQEWGSSRFVSTVTGINTRYNSTVQVDVGIGFGPVEITTAHR